MENRKFTIRGEDRRKRNEPVARDRRAGPRRMQDATTSEESGAELKAALRALEQMLRETEGTLEEVAAGRDPDEVTQIPTRNEKLAGAVRSLADAQAGLLDLVRAAKTAARLTPELRAWVVEVAERACDVEEKLADHMAERLHIDRPDEPPRARRLIEKLRKVMG